MGEREECELGDREKLREKGKECEWERGGGRVWIRREKNGGGVYVWRKRDRGVSREKGKRE